MVSLAGSADPEDNYTEAELKELKNESVETYEHMWNDFIRAKVVYTLAATYHKKMDLIYFTMPLLILQTLNASLPSFITDATTGKQATTLISAISASWIAAQGKLAWGQAAQKYANCASMYQLLCGSANARITKAKILNKNTSLKDINKALIEFIEYCGNLERQVKNGCPSVPRNIEKRVKKNEEAVQLAARKQQVNIKRAEAGLPPLKPWQKVKPGAPINRNVERSDGSGSDEEMV